MPTADRLARRSLEDAIHAARLRIPAVAFRGVILARSIRNGWALMDGGNIGTGRRSSPAPAGVHVLFAPMPHALGTLPIRLPLDAVPRLARVRQEPAATSARSGVAA